MKQAYLEILALSFAFDTTEGGLLEVTYLPTYGRFK